MHIDPVFTLICIGLFMFSLTVGTIIHVVMIDMRYAKERYRKERVAMIIMWLTITGAIINAPIWYMVFKSLA